MKLFNFFEELEVENNLRMTSFGETSEPYLSVSTHFIKIF
jgi:hypothetical protein